MRPLWLSPESDPCNLHLWFLPLECAYKFSLRHDVSFSLLWWLYWEHCYLARTPQWCWIYTQRVWYSWYCDGRMSMRWQLVWHILSRVAGESTNEQCCHKDNGRCGLGHLERGLYYNCTEKNIILWCNLICLHSAFNTIWICAVFSVQEQSMNHIFLNKKGRPRCYTKAPTWRMLYS